ncbi:MAG: hypothetical protein Q8P40_07315 [Nitrospirota bacterium]|nr:hypothetical protein [Nitrospirota bacterium]
MILSEKTKGIISRLERSFTRRVKRGDCSDFRACRDFQEKHGMKGWEIFFYPETMHYESCLPQLSKNDVVFDAGAGDLRFDLIMSEHVKKVYAVEINPTILAGALKIIGYDMPKNLVAICGNAFGMELPCDTTVVTCLMIHRQHEFPEHWKKCRIIYAYGGELIESTPD